MNATKTDWLTEYARNKRAEEQAKAEASTLFMSNEDAAKLGDLFGEGTEVVGHGLLVRRDGQTYAMMKLMASGEGGGTGGTPPAPAAEAAPPPSAKPEGEAPPPSKPDGGGNILKDPADGNRYVNDFVDGVIDKTGIKPLIDFKDTLRGVGRQATGIIQEQQGD